MILFPGDGKEAQVREMNRNRKRDDGKLRRCETGSWLNMGAQNMHEDHFPPCVSESPERQSTEKS